MFSRKCIFKESICHWYVRLPECTRLLQGHNMSQLLCRFLNRYQVSPLETHLQSLLGNLGCWHELPPLKGQKRIHVYKFHCTDKHPQSPKLDIKRNLYGLVVNGCIDVFQRETILDSKPLEIPFYTSSKPHCLREAPPTTQVFACFSKTSGWGKTLTPTQHQNPLSRISEATPHPAVIRSVIFFCTVRLQKLIHESSSPCV